MYTPEAFHETNPERLLTLIRAYPFGMLITVDNGLPCVNHLPFLYEQHDSGIPVLLGHLAKANPQWQHLASGQTALVVFQGPHAYVSPGWYSSPGVPTWNYATVHVHGIARIFDDETETEGLLNRLTAVYESTQPKPWQAKFSDERRAKLLGMIVGFEIPIDGIQGKFKLSQNRPADDQRAVADRLLESGAPLSIAVAELMGHEH